MTQVDLTNFFSWTFLLHFIRALVTFNISNAILKSKKNTYVTFLSIVIPSLIYSCVSLQFATRDNETFFMYAYYVLTFVVICFATEGSIFAKLFATIFSHAVYITANYFAVAIASFLLGSDFSIGLNFSIKLNEFFVACLSIFSLSFIFVAIINLIKSKTDLNFKYKTKYIFYYLFPITHVFSTSLIYTSINIVASDGFSGIMGKQKFFEAEIALIVLLCLIFDVCIIFIVDRQSRTEEKNIRNERELLKNELVYSQMQLLKKEQSEFRKLKHDYMNLLTTASGFIEIGKPEKALEIIRKTGSDLAEISGTPLCSNETINTVCYIKQEAAEKLNVKLKIKIEETAFLKIDEYDLCRLLHNIMDNAIDACSRLDDKRTAEIFIDINPETFRVKSVNRYQEKKKAKDKSGNRGNGIGIIKDIAQKYSGTYKASQDGNMYITLTELKNTAVSA